MGAGSSVHSKKIETPEGYDGKKFNLIRVMFDKLDQTGDMIIPDDSLHCLSEFYVGNQLGSLQRQLDTHGNKLQTNIQGIKKEKDDSIKEFIRKRDAEVKEVKEKYKSLIQEVEEDYQNEVHNKNEEIQHSCDTICDEMNRLKKATNKDSLLNCIVTSVRGNEQRDITFDDFYNFICNNKLDENVETLQTMTRLVVEHELNEMRGLLGQVDSKRPAYPVSVRLDIN